MDEIQLFTHKVLIKKSYYLTNKTLGFIVPLLQNL